MSFDIKLFKEEYETFKKTVETAKKEKSFTDWIKKVISGIALISITIFPSFSQANTNSITDTLRSTTSTIIQTDYAVRSVERLSNSIKNLLTEKKNNNIIDELVKETKNLNQIFRNLGYSQANAYVDAKRKMILIRGTFETEREYQTVRNIAEEYLSETNPQLLNHFGEDKSQVIILADGIFKALKEAEYVIKRDLKVSDVFLRMEGKGAVIIEDGNFKTWNEIQKASSIIEESFSKHLKGTFSPEIIVSDHLKMKLQNLRESNQLLFKTIKNDNYYQYRKKI